MGMKFLLNDVQPEDLSDEQNLLFLQWSQYISPEYHKELFDLISDQGKNGYAINNGQYYKKDNAWRSSENFELNAYVLATHPETFFTLKEKKIGVWHGSNGNGIASILEHGLVASAFHEEHGIIADFGEKELSKNVYWGGEKSFISASADLRVAMRYATLNLEGGDDARNFFSGDIWDD